jgi:hypothetical protein
VPAAHRRRGWLERLDEVDGVLADRVRDGHLAE